MDQNISAERLARLAAGLPPKALPAFVHFGGDARANTKAAWFMGSRPEDLQTISTSLAATVMTAHGLCFLAENEDDNDPSDHFALRGLKDGRWGLMRLSDDSMLLEWLAVDKPTPVEAVLAAIRNLEGLDEVPA